MLNLNFQKTKLKEAPTANKRKEKSLLFWRQSYLDYCRDVRKMSAQTMVSRENIVDNFCRYAVSKKAKRPSQLTTRLVDDYVAWIRNECNNNNNTTRTKLTIVKLFLNYIRDMGGQMGVKLLLIDKVKGEPVTRRAFTREEVNKALRMADRDAWLMIKLSFECAMRLSEVAGIEVDNIHGNRIDFIGKGNKPGTVFITDEIKEHINDWIERTHPEKWLWEYGAKVQDKSPCQARIRIKMKRAFEAAGLEGFHPHALRYSCATEMAEMGVPTRQIQLVLRHNSVATTEKYICNQVQMTQEAFMNFRKKIGEK